MVRQVPPALRRWLRGLLGTHAGEALQSPLTFTHGIFSEAPIMEKGLLEAAMPGEWAWGLDDAAAPTWAETPWPHDVMVTAEETQQGAFEALLKKAVVTRAAGRRVLLVVATAREWKALRTLGAALVLEIPPGGVPWGDAVGWPDVQAKRGELEVPS